MHAIVFNYQFGMLQDGIDSCIEHSCRYVFTGAYSVVLYAENIPRMYEYHLHILFLPQKSLGGRGVT